MKKFAAILLALSCVSALADTFVANSVCCKAGYEGDVYNAVAMTLTLNADSTFVLVDNTSIVHNSYVVVTNWFTTVTGTYEVVEEEEDVKVVKLTAVSGIHVMNGSVETREENAEMLEDYQGQEYECDNNTFSLIVND